MKYQISIKGMHCSGCMHLIHLTLEEAGFKDIVVDLDKNNAEFSSKEDKEKTATLLDNAFKDIPQYSYSDLILLP